MILRPLTKQQCERVRQWRVDARETLRTPHMQSELEQKIFFENVVSNPNSPHRYYAIEWTEDHVVPAHEGRDHPTVGTLIGCGGLTNIQWENRIAEISLIINPEYREKGYGKEAVFLLLDEAFNRINLKTVCGEVYACNSAYDFWAKMSTEILSCWVTLPNRKYWNGKYHHGQYFSFDRDDYERLQK